MSRTELDNRPGPASLLLTIIGMSAAVGVIGCWLFVSYVLWALWCDDVCSGDDGERSLWIGQLVLSVSGSVLALTAVVLALAGLKRGCRLALVGAASCAVLWLLVIATF